MKETLLLAATLMVALPGATQADPPVGPGQPPIRQTFPGPQAVPVPQPAIALAKKIHRAPNGKAFPAHWGAPPRLKTRDLRLLPGGYGRGSGTLARWIQQNLTNDATNGVPGPPVLTPAVVAPAPPVAPTFDPAAEANKGAKADLAKVQAGIKAWQAAKAKCKGNYSYTVGFESWVGFGHVTMIVVTNNKVTERRYRSFNRRRPVAPPRPGVQAPQKPEGASWVEQGKAIGTNKQGAPAKRLDELYVMALETAKKRLRHFERRYVRSDKQGLLISCYIMDRTIADDAPRKGLVISKITLAGGNAKKVFKAPNGKPFPAYWGAPPLRQTRDLRPLPGGYGRGSGTLARWISGQLALDAKNPNRVKLKPPIAAPAPPPDPVAPAPNAPKVNPADIAKVKTALAAWAKAKAECKGNYEYTIGFSSAFGFGHTTTIVVKNNKVVERRYEEFNRREGPPRPGAKPKGFVEQGDAIGKNKKGVPAKTLDEIYKTAAAIAAKALPPHEVRYVLTDKNGLLTSCFIRDRRIADDAPRNGVALGKITLTGGNAKKVFKSPNGKPFLVHWGAPPLRQTRDRRPLPGGYGRGSSTLRNWIQKNLDQDAKKNNGGIQIQPVPQRVGLPAPPPRPQVAPPRLLGPPLRAPVPPPVGDCALCRTEAHQLHLGLAENGGTITVKLGSVVRVKLRGNPTTGFTWNNATPTGVLKLLGKVAHQAGGRPGLLGAPGMSTATFATMKLGKGTIVLHYNRVFEKNKAPASTVKINIVVTKDGRVQPPVAPGKNTPRIAELEKEIAKLKDFARRARFTPAGLKAHQAKLTKLEQEMAALKAGGKVAGVPTFEEWVKGGKKIPAGRVFLGGSPWFNERTGQRRQPQEVYAMLFRKPATAKPAGRFPPHWGAPPRIQTKDLRLLPGGYGRGSSTLARWIQQNLDKDKANPNRGKAGQDPKGGVLPSKLTLKDAQGGFAGFTGWVTTINEDGTWNRRQFFNQQLRPIEKQGKLTAAQAKAIKAALTTAQIEKLPARLGKFQGANPHVLTLTCGEKQIVLTLPAGPMPLPLLQPGDKLTDTGRFTLLAHELDILAAAGGLKKIPTRIYRAANGKAFPAHWGAPPRIQTRDFRPLPGGYGNGSSTLGRWIQQNLDKDKAGSNTTKPVAPPNAANGKEITQLETRVNQIKNFMARARLTKEARDRFLAEIKRLENRIAELNGKPQVVRPPVRPPVKPNPNARKKFPAHWGAPPRIQTADYRKLPGGYGSGSSTMAGWIQRNLDADAKNPNRGKPEAGQHPAVSVEFAKKRPAGSYAPGELLVGMQKGTAPADSQKALQQAIPGFVLVKAMVNGTVLHVRLPATMNVEQGMAKLKTVKSVRYAELNGIVRIQPIPRPGLRIPPRKLGKPLIRPRR